MAVLFFCLFDPIVFDWCDVLGLGCLIASLVKSVPEPMAAEEGAHLFDR